MHFSGMNWTHLLLIATGLYALWHLYGQLGGPGLGFREFNNWRANYGLHGFLIVLVLAVIFFGAWLLSKQ